MINFSIEELMSKTGVNDKYKLTRLAIQRVKELIKEKNKRALLDSQEKLTTIVLKEMKEGKIRVVDELKIKKNSTNKK